MNAAYRRLATSLPAPAGSAFAHDARALRAWIDALPMANFQIAARRMLDGLQAFNRTRSEGVRRLEALETLRGTVAQLAAAADKQIIGSSFPLPPQKRELGALALGFQAELALGYRLALAELCAPAGSVPFLRSKQVVLAATRALQHGADWLDKACLLYRTPPAGAWQALHDVHRYIAALRLADRSVEDGQGQIDARTAYVQALLVALANPYRYTQREQGELVALARVLAPLAQLRERGGSGDVVVRTDVDRGPGYLPEESASATSEEVSLHLAPMIAVVAERLAAVEGARSVTIRGRGGPAQTLDAPLARRFLAGWSAHGERSHARVGGGHVLDTVIGLQDLHATLAGGEDFETFMQHVRGQVISLADLDYGASWAKGATGSTRTLKFPARVIDQGLGGYRLLWERGSGNESVRARVAELVGLSLPADADGERGDWMVGVIRWIRIDDEGRVDAGVELLARRALPVGLRTLDDSRRPPVRGVLLAPLNGAMQPPEPGMDYDALLASTEIDRGVRELELTAPPDLIGPPMPARSGRIGNLRVLEATGIYQHFGLAQH
ncbi:MAG: hypothetical protein ACTHK2_11890 [Dokdonella sp.]|uniref:hypothetical protein n=1 Tax=Dokdonella sp. TaxID=2291710 RepID=UPI003F7EE5D4